MLKFLRKSLLSQLVTSFSLLSLVTVSLVAIAAYVRARDSLRDSVYNRLQVATSLKEYQLDDWVKTQYQDVQLIARSPTIARYFKYLLNQQEQSTPLTPESDRQEIIKLQQLLQDLGYYDGELDGIYGRGLEQAVAKFKESYNIESQDLLNLSTIYQLIAYEEISQELSEFSEVKPSLQEISLLSTGGIVALSTNPTKEKTYQPLGETTTYFNHGQSDTVIPSFYTSPITRKSAITLGTPILAESGERLGVLTVDLDLQGIDEIIREKTGLGQTGATYLIGRLGNRNVFISQQATQGQENQEELKEVDSLGIQQATQGIDGVGLYRNYQGIPVIGAYVWMANQNLALLAEMSQAEAFAPAHQLLKEILQIGLSAALFLLIIIYLISRRITQPILGITETAIQVSAGNLRSQAPVLTEDEIGTLAQAFNQMIDQLQESKNELENQVTAATQSLQDTLANLTSIIDNIADGLLVTNTDGTITQSNQALFKLFGLEQGSLVNRRSEDIFGGTFAELGVKVKKNPENIFNSEIDLSENRIGKIVATGVFKTDPQLGQQFIGCVFLVRDITTDKEVDRMKTEFISTVSHELRTPLTSVLGFAKLIKKKLEEVLLPRVDVTEKKVERAVTQVSTNLDIIVSEGVRLTALINDVLDIAKMEAGKVDWKHQPVAITQVIERATVATTSLFSQNDIQLVVEVEENLPSILGDEDKLMQVVINLISNAVKFTDRGMVSCKAEKRGETVVVQVIDTGIGIQEEDLPKVFEKFKQVGDTLINKPKGTGLGLPICKEIIEHHGGHIWVESEVGVGSTFAFWLPISESKGDMGWPQLVQKLTNVSPDYQDDQQQRRRVILVVDDDANIRELLTQHLDVEGYEVRQAANGQEAIAQIKQQKPDLVVLDVMMPELNGFDVAAILKNDPETMQIPILMISADDRSERGYRIGVDHYLTKPISSEQFLQRVQTLLKQQYSSKRVLVFDQKSSSAQTLTEILQAQGYHMKVMNTEDALFAAHPDLVITDVNISNTSRLVKTLNFQKGNDQIIVLLLENPPMQNGHKTEVIN
ncbi:MAG: response regulator [Roseofilum sp. SBFL]|uniref:ATP-binding protein n=1 Tax=unclassified Roseofilum TaxID=2620099 RepID=UPI001B1C63F2|nr:MULTISPECIES: ATP-binding protein [unclassified Roseofilum]MBP0012319.1 response regulator [Roseofilum sp. SID3]MBP0022759.1 response regulator [Roseofilum sp. SID2]MBP0037058.1 response regulator [Roseofilum sp. SID1]MBP0041448.1 response regulator [Roseofilum sp. SBFL]